MTFAEQVIEYHFSIDPNWTLPDGISILYPYGAKDVQDVFVEFYLKYFNDHNKRYFLFGINPGRFGAGVTGIPFTDPKTLEKECTIYNGFQKKNELSSIFVYDFINALDGPREFYTHFYITSLCPLGFIKDEKNYNYYDDKKLYTAVEQKIIDNINSQKVFGCHEKVAFSMGKGRNFQYFKKLNGTYRFFKEIVPLPHPRWVMQYRLKSKGEHVLTYKNELKKALD